MRHLVSLSIVISLVTFLFVAPGCQQKPKEEVKPAEVTEPAKEMGKEVMEEGKEAKLSRKGRKLSVRPLKKARKPRGK